MSEYSLQLAEKESRVRDLLSPFITKGESLLPIDTFASDEQHYRQRAEFRIWHEGVDLYHIMFNQETKQQYRVDSFPVASLLINQVMADVINQVKVNPVLRKKLFQIDYLSATTNQIVVSMLYHTQLGPEWEVAIQALQKELSEHYDIHFIGRAKKQKLVVSQDFVTERLAIHNKVYTFKHIENSFTQPNAQVNCRMIEWVATHTQNISGDLLELYCGAGNFTIPLSDYFDRVVATEISKTSVNAAQFNIAANHLDNCTILRMSSEEFVQAKNKEREFRRLAAVNLDEYNFSTVLVDPPRAGLDDDTIAMISQYDNIIYISCNPETLAENLATLTLTHEIVRSALFDQFPFTHHIESGVILQKR
ncbi:MAG: tRNA (uridine(54)-C5)-methyltransferase TrmA [Glaciecola sp.]|jgi:tRNA (uracil-5-)-methyltransferase|nr:tRNA (uridine(54)-C5)-methyltransferase TrmA [Glaciecola sp.]MDG1922795.1 tRNA (uridine(54)-C5)-methyltransferase TrmA [Glaciecola sp.]